VGFETSNKGARNSPPNQATMPTKTHVSQTIKSVVLPQKRVPRFCATAFFVTPSTVGKYKATRTNNAIILDLRGQSHLVSPRSGAILAKRRDFLPAQSLRVHTYSGAFVLSGNVRSFTGRSMLRDIRFSIASRKFCAVEPTLPFSLVLEVICCPEIDGALWFPGLDGCFCLSVTSCCATCLRAGSCRREPVRDAVTEEVG